MRVIGIALQSLEHAHDLPLRWEYGEGEGEGGEGMGECGEGEESNSEQAHVFLADILARTEETRETQYHLDLQGLHRLF